MQGYHKQQSPFSLVLFYISMAYIVHSINHYRHSITNQNMWFIHVFLVFVVYTFSVLGPHSRDLVMFSCYIFLGCSLLLQSPTLFLFLTVLAVLGINSV
jgi:hypothetical protein